MTVVGEETKEWRDNTGKLPCKLTEGSAPERTLRGGQTVITETSRVPLHLPPATQ